MLNIQEIQNLIARGALFVINHSGGKDSQAMTAELKKIIPTDQIIVVHATLPGMEWEGTLEHIENTTTGLDLKVCSAGKTFEEMVCTRFEKRPEDPNFPSPKYRQCTSDLKRSPIEKLIRHYMKENNLSLIVNCMGLRAEESSARAKANTFKLNERNSKAGREWYDWLPIHDFTIDMVWDSIMMAQQKRHWAYDVGASRLSCALCIMSTKADLIIGAKHNPNVFEMLSKLEAKTGCTMMMPKKGENAKTLKELIGA